MPSLKSVIDQLKADDAGPTPGSDPVFRENYQGWSERWMFKKILDVYGRAVDVPIIGNVTSGFGSGGTTEKLINDVIFNLGARLALQQITGQDFNYDKPGWRSWWKDNKDKFDPWMDEKKEK